MERVHFTAEDLARTRGRVSAMDARPRAVPGGASGAATFAASGGDYRAEPHLFPDERIRPWQPYDDAPLSAPDRAQR
ncbi:hypothetical protein [Streptomyces sp. IBSNAI001]|uniref:hypothetical protein n=1 Tax=Streptomyces sp. IBSNAI001 TaxID=3457499 RepID=UPI003FD26901